MPFHTVSLPALLWELAVTFGAVRLKASARGYEVAAIGDELPWAPYHSREDLLWTRVTEQISDPESLPGGGAEVTPAKQARQVPRPVKAAPRPSVRALRGSYPVGAEHLLQVVAAIRGARTLPDERGMKAIGVTSPRTYADYRNFLESGGFVTRASSSEVSATDQLDQLWDQWVAGDLDAALGNLLKVPSFGDFVRMLEAGPIDKAKAEAAGLSGKAFRAYAALSELLGASFTGLELVHPTPENPPPRQFTSMAVEVYEALLRRGGDPYVLTGEWLEELARVYRVHPVHARQRLEEARTSGHLRRIVEGSSPATGQRSRPIQLLRAPRGRPTVQAADLYDGRFLLTDRAAVRIQLEKRDDGTQGTA